MMTRFAWTALAALVLAPHAIGQHNRKIDLQLDAFLERPHLPGTEVDLFIHGPREAVFGAVKAQGGIVKMATAGLTSARVPVAQVRALAGHPAVERFEFSLDPGTALNDSMRVKNRVEPVHMGAAPLPAAYDGEGVLMGIIDAGLDHRHPDFQHPDGRTRVLKYWDQTLGFNATRTPQPYNYGQVWDSTHINAGQMTSVDQASYFGHGSSVTGTAAGNGLANGRHKGVAPKSDLIVVSSRFNAPNWRATVADAVKYILDEAEALGRPVVINASLGTYLGSHDGKDAAALLIDEMLKARGGRAMVCAAGNSNAFAPYHLRTEVGPDTTFTWFRNNPTSGLGFPAVFFEAWADTADLDNVRYAVGADRTTPGFQFRGRTPFHSVSEHLDSVIVDTLKSFDGHRIGVAQLYAARRGGQYLLQVLVRRPDSSSYNFRFMTTGLGRFDVWSSSQFRTSNIVTAIPDPGEFPPIVDYVLPDNDQHMVDSWACSPHVITVANYYNEVAYTDCAGGWQQGAATEGDISANSSKGPTRDGRLKPDVAASGDITMSPAPLNILANLMANEPFKVAEGCMHARNGGTSMASPVVAGTVSLYLQKCPSAPHSEVMAAITSTARNDAFTGSLPNNQWGHGKLDAFAALVTSNRDDFNLAVDGPAAFCQGEQVQVSAPDGFNAFHWSNGATGNPLMYSEAGPLSLVARDASGCAALSDTLTFVVHPRPDTPVVTANGNELASTPAVGYQWFRDGSPLGGETGQRMEAAVSGNYHVRVTDANGCSAESDPVLVIITGIPPHVGDHFLLWPSPANDRVTVRIPSGKGQATVRLMDANGRVVLEETVANGPIIELSLRGLASGTYIVRALLDDGHPYQRLVKLP